MKLDNLLEIDFDKFARQYFASFTGQIFIKTGDKLVIRETNELNNNEINVYRNYDIGYFERLEKQQFKYDELTYDFLWKREVKFDHWSSKE